MKFILLFTGLLCAAWLNTSNASIIGVDGFSDNATQIGFDGLSTFDGTEYSLSDNVTFSNPGNISPATKDDFSITDFNFIGWSGADSTLLVNRSRGTEVYDGAPTTVTFAEEVYRAGFNWSASRGYFIDIVAKDSDGVVLEHFRSSQSNSYGENFVGISTDTAIDTLEIYSVNGTNKDGNFVFDNLLFDDLVGGVFEEVFSALQNDVSVNGGTEGAAGGLQFGEVESGSTLYADYAALGSETGGTFAAGESLLGGVINHQVWDIHYDGDLTDGIEILFNYDDTGMTQSEEEAMSMWHSVGGQWVNEGGLVNTQDNTILLTAYSFSLYEAASTGGNDGVIITDVPEPFSLVIFALGMIGLASRQFNKQH